MPIPFLVWAGIAAAAAFGGGKTIKAAVDTNEAKKTNAEAEKIAKKATQKAEQSRTECNSTLDALGRNKVTILKDDMEPFISSFEKIHNIELRDTSGTDELRKFTIDKTSLGELKKLTSVAGSIAGAAGSGAAAGALTAMGAYGAATTLATASTGTAIASLSGAAATNATLAWFGGGSLAAGGLGMAGGAAVLGGLVAAPALVVMGCIMGAKASKLKDEAYSNLAQAKKYREEMKTVRTLCDGIRDRANMFSHLLIELGSIFEELVHELEQVIRSSGTDFRRYSESEKRTVEASLAVAKAVKAVLDTPILTKDGKLTSESREIIAPVQRAIAEYAGA